MSQFFLQDHVALELLSLDKPQVVEFLKKLAAVSLSWTPTKCAVRIEKLTGLAMAASSSSEYAAAWVYALALLVEVDPIEVTLTDKQVEVAFALLKHYERLRRGVPLVELKMRM